LEMQMHAGLPKCLNMTSCHLKLAVHAASRLAACTAAPAL